MSSQTKIFTVTGSQGGVMINEKASFLVGNEKNFVAASSGGVSIMAKGITLGTTSDNVRVGGLFVWMNDFLKMIPSTIVTPIPSQIPFPPLGLAVSLVQTIPFFTAMAVGAASITAATLATGV